MSISGSRSILGRCVLGLNERCCSCDCCVKVYLMVHCSAHCNDAYKKGPPPDKFPPSAYRLTRRRMHQQSAELMTAPGNSSNLMAFVLVSFRQYMTLPVF